MVRNVAVLLADNTFVLAAFHMQIQMLGKQIFPGQSKYAMDSYLKATPLPYRYLCVDLNPHTSKEYQLSTNRGTGETPIIHKSIQWKTEHIWYNFYKAFPQSKSLR